MSGRLEGKVAVITGGASGIGEVTVRRFVEEGAELRVIHLSACEESVPQGFDRDVLREESKNAMSVLGILPENHLVERFAVRKFPDVRQEILELFVKLREFNPDLVLLPSTTPTTTDHSFAVNALHRTLPRA